MTGRSLLAAALLTLSAAVVHAAPADQDTAGTTSAPQQSDLAGAKCIIGMEKFLPGEYFYCLGAQNYGLDHFNYSKKFFTEAAGWASKPAQYVLGVLAFNGDHQPVDHALGLAWMSLAAERGTVRFTEPLAEYTAKATPEERERSKRIRADLEKTYADRVAAPRAEQRYRSGVQTIRPTASPGRYCMEGQLDFRDLAGATGNSPNCATTEEIVRFIDSKAPDVFEDWSGHVTVGALQTDPTSGAAKPR